MNVKSPYRVHMVLDPNFGERLAEMPADEPVWLPASPANESAALKFPRSTKSHLDGVSLFQAYEVDLEESFLDLIDTVDLHHGEHSAKPAYSLIEVVGCRPSEKVRSALAELGFAVGAVTTEGFSAQRSTTVA